MINNGVGPMNFGSNNITDDTWYFFVVPDDGCVVAVTNLLLLGVVVVWVVNEIFKSNVPILLFELDGGN